MKAATLGRKVVLKDGSHIRIRRWRRSDRQLLVEGFYRLSPDSSYRRFLTSSPVLTPDMLHELTDVDHHEHEAVIALDKHGRHGLGIAHYRRDPARRDAAEVALVVIDDWQGRGLGTVLLDAISARARRNGITIFTALMLEENHRMRHLLERLGPLRVTAEGRGTVQTEVAIGRADGQPEVGQRTRHR